MKILILILFPFLLFAQDSNRKYMIIEAKVLEKCDPGNKEYDQKTVDELLSLGIPFPSLLANGNRFSDDSLLVIVEYHKLLETVTKEEEDAEEIKLTSDLEYQSSKEKEKYKKHKANDEKCADKKTKKYIKDSFRWLKYFKDEQEIYDYLNTNSKDWDGVDDTKGTKDGKNK